MTSQNLTELYAAEFAKLRARFESDGQGGAILKARSDLVDGLVTGLFGQLMGSADAGSGGVSLVTLGGYGRRELFPYSDVDLLLLAKSQRVLDNGREPFAVLTRTLWDLGLRVGSTSRLLDECGSLDRKNLEFSIALLDSRHLAGDADLTSQLHESVIPKMVASNRATLVADLVEMTAERHEKFGDTIFHLEPNVKDAPGGLRDYQVARWLELLRDLGAHKRWAPPEEKWPKALAGEAAEALPFLTDVRACVHFAHGRDHNQLSYELQEAAAQRGVGVLPGGKELSPAEWMRIYFRRARGVSRLARQLLDDAVRPRPSLLGRYRDWKSRFSTPYFSVVRGEIHPRRPEVSDLPALLAALELMARHGLELSRESERWAENLVEKIQSKETLRTPLLWNDFRKILAAPDCARALRAMHRLGLLNALFPEFRAVDALVLRDFYHRYTVDEHTLRTIENLGRLRQGRRWAAQPDVAKGGKPLAAGETHWEPQFGEVLAEIEQPELLVLSLLFHDVGKGIPGRDHVEGSLAALEQVFRRLALEPEERETVRFLISKHLEMSRTVQRRDIFAPETVREFAEKIGTPERLKMLTLMTYTDIQSVNPEALTPWKAEMLWQLYTVTSNYFSRSLDEERLPADSREQAMTLAAAIPEEARGEFAAFLEGFPRRYLRSHSPEIIHRHFQMAQGLANAPAEIRVEDRGRFWELTVVTRDRPFLFASLTGTLAAWGMNILKADAFGNAHGVVLDIFRFADAHRTLELNPGEIERFKENLTSVLAGRENVEGLLARRAAPRTKAAKLRIPTQVRFEQPPSLGGPQRTTLVELITQDRPGLLYQVSSALAELALNIEVALIDTEGEKVIDVFYLTEKGHPLAPATQKTLADTLRRKLQPA